MRPPTIIHYHIFKNSGTSVDYALKAAFGVAWTSFEGNHAHDILREEKLRTFLDTHLELMAVSSHLARPPLPYENSLPILFLRHPILRAKSVYEFVKNDNTQPNHEMALNGFCEYIRWALFEDSGGGVVIKNYQVIHLSDASFRTKSILNATAQLSDLRQAELLLFSWPVFGIVESYEKSIALFQKCYGHLIHGLQLPVVWLNKCNNNTSHNISIEAQLEAICVDLGDELFNELCLANNLDLSLYQSCVKRFEENVTKYLSGDYLGNTRRL
jgi:hypothetical protein